MSVIGSISVISSIHLPRLDGSDGFRLDGVAAGDQSGFSVSGAGDVNGDGFDDVIVGARLADPNGNESGASYVIFGKATGFSATLDLSSLDGSTGFRLDGVAAYDRLGGSVSSAGDVNGDGFDDLIIGARLTDQSGYNYSYSYSSGSGASYVVFGKASGFNATLDLSSLDGSNGFRLDGKLAYSASGHLVSTAGDVNGDGFDDLIIGAPDPLALVPEDEYSRSGNSYVVFGKSSGFSATLDLSSLDKYAGFHLDGQIGDHLGYSVSSAGDVNGDGFDDLIVGTRRIDPSDYSYSSGFGASYVVFGKASGLSGTLNLSSLDGNSGFRMEGELLTYGVSAHSVSSAGDVNGDGFDDVIIGSRGANSNDTCYVVFGKSSGFGATLDLSSLDGGNGFRIDGESAYGAWGHSVSNAGDVNGDGFDDVIVGALGVDSNGNNAGASYLLYGKASGFSAAVNLSDLDGNIGLRLDGVAKHDYLGSSISSAGDINGDSFDDLIVGAPGADINGNESGVSYVIFGSSDFNGKVTYLGTAGDDNLTGTSAAERFDAGTGDDMLIGRGGADVFHGGAGDDIIRISDLDFQLVDGGSGNDTLSLANSGLNLNLASVHSKISGIEAINLYGTGNNTLTLTALDLLNLSDSSNTLKVNGNVGDNLVGISDGWTDRGIQGNFHVYASDAAVLLVGVNVTTDFVSVPI